MASRFLEALTPKVEMTFSDSMCSCALHTPPDAALSSLPIDVCNLRAVVDEVHRLREENANLKRQVTMLTNLRPSDEPNSTPLAQHDGGDSGADDGDAEGSGGVAADAGNGGAAGARGSGGAPAEASLRCLVHEVSLLEAAAEQGRMRASVEREALAMRCDELGHALEQRVLQAERTQQAAVAAARQANADTIAQLEEQLATMAEAAARRDALDEEYGTEAELGAVEQRVVEAVARLERSESAASALRDELSAERAAHAGKLERAAEEEARVRAEADELRGQASALQSTNRQLEAQLVRLSEGFNKQVEEVLALQATLQEQRARCVEKAVARGWVVTYVEQGSGPHADEILRMLAEWWDFTKEDLVRVGLSDEIHPSVEVALAPPAADASMARAFADFLEGESSGESRAGAASRTALSPTRGSGRSGAPQPR